MVDHKSQAEFVLGALQAQLVDCEALYPGLALEFRRDALRLGSILKCHGLFFFVETMSVYRKHLDQCLDKRRLTSTTLPNFGSWRRSGTIPRLFRGLFLRVFEENGKMLDHPDHTAIRLLRQLLGVCRRLRIEAGTKDRCEAVESFYQDDLSVRVGTSQVWDDPLVKVAENRDDAVHFRDLVCDSEDGCGIPNSLPPLADTALHNAPPHTEGQAGQGVLLTMVQQVADLITSHLGVFDPYAWHPRHGPGAVSDQRFGYNKYAFERWPDRLESVFPYSEFGFANLGIWGDQIGVEGSITDSFCKEAPARLIAVPKTLTKPRLIASEPVSNQWCQQIIRDYFYTRVSETFIGNFVSFRCQDHNGKLALEASHTRSHVTIDLSCASDLVSCWHVERLFRGSTSLLSALAATRSRCITQDISGRIPNSFAIRKYSTMGNATIFPVQSIFFLTLALASSLYARGLGVSLRNIDLIREDRVRVFGDDIIVPDYASKVLLELLETLGLRVNKRKTFTEGNFRESCGVDAFDGHDVTTVCILEVPVRAGPSAIASSVAVHHNLLERGYAYTAAFVRKAAELCGYDKIRTVKHGSGVFGWSDMLGDDGPCLKRRWNRYLHVSEIRCLALRSKSQRNPAVEHHGLLQYFTEAPLEARPAAGP